MVPRTLTILLVTPVPVLPPIRLPYMTATQPKEEAQYGQARPFPHGLAVDRIVALIRRPIVVHCGLTVGVPLPLPTVIRRALLRRSGPPYLP